MLVVEFLQKYQKAYMDILVLAYRINKNKNTLLQLKCQNKMPFKYFSNFNIPVITLKEEVILRLLQNKIDIYV
jgi:hypothetical protein